MSDYETVPAAEVPDDAAILDVREPYEFEPGHVPGAVHIPVDDIPARFQELDPDEDYYVLCRSGGRASRIAGWLTSQGFSAILVAGGYGEWLNAEKPLESSTGEDPRIL